MRGGARETESGKQGKSEGKGNEVVKTGAVRDKGRGGEREKESVRVRARARERERKRERADHDQQNIYSCEYTRLCMHLCVRAYLCVYVYTRQTLRVYLGLNLCCLRVSLCSCVLVRACRVQGCISSQICVNISLPYMQKESYRTVCSCVHTF